MPSLLQQPFSEIIRLLPVDEHSEEIAANRWQDRFTTAGQQEHFEAIFHQQSNVGISRGHLLNFEGGNRQQKCLEIMLWGYPQPGRMRGHATAFLRNIAEIAVRAVNDIPWTDYYAELHRIGHLAISTITKLAYFFNRQFDGDKALILDNKIIEICASHRWRELQELPPLSDNNADGHYPAYLRCMSEIAGELKCRPDQIECFLFFFGKAF
jgi:hypothetical protein